MEITSKTYLSLKVSTLRGIIPLRGDTHYEELTVIPETIGQYTELPDKHGRKVFDGDIIRWHKSIYYVRWDKKMAKFVFAKKPEDVFFVAGFTEYTIGRSCEVIGNIHDNPELLSGEIKMRTLTIQNCFQEGLR